MVLNVINPECGVSFAHCGGATGPLQPKVVTVIDAGHSALGRVQSCDAPSVWSALGQQYGAFDVVHLHQPKRCALLRYFPYVSRHGLAVADETGESGDFCPDATAYADEHDLIAIRQLGKIAISRVDVVALLGLTAHGYFPRVGPGMAT